MLKPSYESTHHSIIDGHLTPLEIGIYILVAVLCAAIAVLMASCFVSASKYRRQMYPVSLTASLSQHILQERSSNNNKKPIQNANDWVWLGKSTSTLDKSTESVRSSCHSEIVNVIQNPQDNLQVRILVHPGKDFSSYLLQLWSFAGTRTNTIKPVEYQLPTTAVPSSSGDLRKLQTFAENATAQDTWKKAPTSPAGQLRHLHQKGGGSQ